MTFGERRKRADSKQIVADMDSLESSFLSTTQKLNKKRREQLKKRLSSLLPELEKKFDSGKVEEVERLLETLKMPSSREWYKAITTLVDSSARTGVLRAHFELLKLRELYEFNISVKEGANSFKVVFPKEAETFIKDYGYQIGVITEETTRQRIRDTVMDSLHEGARGRDLVANVNKVTDTWVSQTHAETIARTETAKMYNAGRVARYTDPAQDGFVEALQYDSIVDTRTTDLCEGLNGKIVNINDSATISRMTPPNHFRCRATWVAVSRYEDWVDDFPRTEIAQEGFEFESPLPALLKGTEAKKPLVQPVKPVKASTAKNITDPLLIRNLDDEGFREAIGNITDAKMKYYLVKERSEQIALNSGMVSVSRGVPEFKGGIYSDDSVRFQLSPNSKNFIVPKASQTVQFEMDDLFKLIAKDPTNQKHIEKAIDAFLAKNSGDRAFLLVNKSLMEAKKLGVVDAKFNGFVTHKMTKEAEDLMRFKMPTRLTPTYKKDLVIQANKESAEKFLLANLHPKLAPANGIEFKYNGRIRRAFARGDTINLGPRTGAEVIVHEAGHVIHNNKEIQGLINTFFRERTDNLKMVSSSLYGEKVIRDDFYHPYIGRIYGWENKGNYGQEVLSMGLQAMYENPAKFYLEDREHFMLINAIMGGLF